MDEDHGKRHHHHYRRKMDEADADADREIVLNVRSASTAASSQLGSPRRSTSAKKRSRASSEQETADVSPAEVGSAVDMSVLTNLELAKISTFNWH